VKVEIVKVERLYNLGNYETLRVGYEAVLTELEGANSQEVLKATADLEKLCDQYYQAGRFQKQPQEKPKEPEPPLEKGIIIDLETLAWQDMPATEKGVWQKSETKNASYYAVKKAIEEKDGRPAFMEGYIVWLNSDETLGRRKK